VQPSKEMQIMQITSMTQRVDRIQWNCKIMATSLLLAVAVRMGSGCDSVAVLPSATVDGLGGMYGKVCIPTYTT
jgi:hypothetical protein